MDLLIQRYRLPLAAFAVLIALSAAALSAFHRLPWSDEGWFSSAAYNLAYHHSLGTTVLEPAGTGLTRIDQRTYWVMPLFLIGQGAWLLLAPATVFSVRLFTLAWHPLAVWALYRFLSLLLGCRATALLAAALLATSYVYVDNAGFARPDIPCAALGLSALAVYLLLRERSLPIAMAAANGCLAAAAMMHPNAIFHALALAAIALWMDGYRLLRFSTLAAAAVPYALAALAWGLYIAQDYPAFYAQMHANGTNGRWTPNWNPVSILWNELQQRYFVVAGFATGGIALLKSVSLLAYAAALAWIFARPGLRSLRPVRLLLLLLALYFTAMSIFNQKLSYYLVHIVPVYTALLAVSIVDLWRRFPRARPLLAASVVALAGLETGGVALKAISRSYRTEQKAMVAAVRSIAAPGDRIDGSASLLYEFGFDPRLKDDIYLGTSGGPAPDIIIIESLYSTVYAAWRTEKPAVMDRIDETLRGYNRVYQRAGYEVYRRRSP